LTRPVKGSIEKLPKRARRPFVSRLDRLDLLDRLDRHDRFDGFMIRLFSDQKMIGGFS
jgi:hypothetical protein